MMSCGARICKQFSIVEFENGNYVKHLILDVILILL